ncbi:MAG: bifunctional DNA-formamidopyrimidine glycosylase/DNA-(apurinic or apyrimidinic site) lyase [Gammaproteobacteria bacterium]|nr:bifunctional DNA-formamidopyrimidine glycosylase/DNA-(apurinic or apyrimidinic site) lyase [Gammaproteobacteria bacterium]NNF67413.1 bifunctional DNA-formamidopyrimidine glycosylase/DNA-(apurinic or apyrimidinic site) lyase [Gammaproteobacteria bacterium]
MPELPEVEITRRGILPAINGIAVSQVIVREKRLRWPVSPRLARDLPGQTIESVDRRAKYLLLRTSGGTLIVHLGMSGSLRALPQAMPARKHDHVDIIFANKTCLRFTDPRRFGSMLWTRRDPLQHKLLQKLGPEPLEDQFDGVYLYNAARGRRCAIKLLIMNAATVVGVGNIYASEALHAAAINPRRAAGRIGLARMQRLAAEIKSVLANAITVGGTTLRDFTGGDGQPGYFQLELNVYDRENEPCRRCSAPVRRIVQGQRSTFYCPVCQT